MLWLWIAYALAIVAVLLCQAAIGVHFKYTLKEENLPENPPLVSTVVPARNEERNIDRCARGLVHQDYPHLELVFVDDDSSDATPDILAQYAEQDQRVKVVQTGGKPEGWNGKQWACHSGAMTAKGDWVCFMDADTYAEPYLLRRTVAFAIARRIDMLTLQPWYEMRGLWERIVLPAGLLPMLLIFPPSRINNPRDTVSVANGQFILIRRAVYDDIDGHAGIKDRMMDDFSLAENVKHAGYRLFVANGADVMRVRMYTNLKEIWAGTLKLSVDICGGWLITSLSLLVNLLLNVMPVVFLLWTIVSSQWTAALVMGATVVFQVTYYGLIRMAGFRLPPWSGITYPIGGMIVTAILLDSMFRLVTGRDIEWKGRSLIGRPDLPIKTHISQKNVRAGLDREGSRN
jgi:chlorobactene glucosyltransferase